jgi:hypothetical protein
MMRIDPPLLPQPDTVWDKKVTFDDNVRKQLPQRVNRKSAVEEVPVAPASQSSTPMSLTAVIVSCVAAPGCWS